MKAIDICYISTFGKTLWITDGKRINALVFLKMCRSAGMTLSELREYSEAITVRVSDSEFYTINKLY